MSLGRKREIISASVATALIAGLYRYWLILPALKYLGVDQWRVVAILIPATIGVVMSRSRLSLLTVACVSTLGVLLGGTWAQYRLEDISISFGFAFRSNLRSFWGDEIVLAVACTLGGLCEARLSKTSSSHAR